MLGRIDSKIGDKSGLWKRIWVSLPPILAFLFLAYILLSPLALRFALLLLIFWACSEALHVSKWLVERVNKRFIALIAMLIALIATSWIVLIQISILPENVNIRFESLYTTTDSFSGENEEEQRENTINFIRESVNLLRSEVQTDNLEDGAILGDSQVSFPMDTVGNIALVQITAIPKPKRVVIMIHPHNTQFWYVQPSLIYKIEGSHEYWEGYIYFGSIGGDCNLKFDLIVLASKEWLLLDVFRGRGIREGMKLDYLPVLNQSETIVVRKSCQQR
jgi:hypothetical protein